MAASNKKYIKNCTGDNCPTNKDDQKTKIFFRFVFYFLCLAFFAVSCYVFVFSPYLQINKIQISGTQELNQEELQQIISQSLEGRFFNVFPKNNFLLLTSGRIENLLLGNYKKIRALQIEKVFPDTIKVNVDERKALLIWCSNQENCYLIDENGTAYSQADFSSPELMQNHLLKIDDQSGAPVKIGEKVISAEFEQYLVTLRESMGTLGLILNDQYLTPSSMSQEIHAKTDSGMDLYFSTQFSLDSAVRTLAVILKKEITKEQRNSVSYIDLRSENKAFYKFSGQFQEDQKSPSDQEKETEKNLMDKKNK